MIPVKPHRIEIAQKFIDGTASMTVELISTARQLAREGKDDEAASVYLRALESIEETPLLAEANGFLGGRHFFSGRYKESLRHFKICAEIFPDQPAAIYDFGQALEKTGDTGGYLTALGLHPRNARYYLYTGAMLETLGRRDEALAV